MRKIRTTALVISILAGILVLSAIVMFMGNGGSVAITEVESLSISQSKSYTTHAPIYISDNSQFTFANGVSNPGAAGTESDPYIIENWDINASSANGIQICNTNAYFIIRNCVIHDGKNNYKYGIYFSTVTYGKIDNATSYNNYHGIYLYYSSNNQLTNCAVYNNYNDGICLSYSSNNNITNCAVYNNSLGINPVGIRLEYSSNNNIITNCAVYNNSADGIELFYSSNNEIHYCNIYDNTNYGIYTYNTESQYQVNATYNWWGSASGPYHPTTNPSGTGDDVTDNVLYNPWLTEPVEGAGWTPPEDEGKGEETKTPAKPFEIPWLYIIIPVIIIVVIVVAAIGIKGRKRRIPEHPAQPPMSPQQYPCPYCGQPLNFIQQYNRWYCDKCKRYV